ncbi:MAG: hypothetical protein Q7S24_01350 [bacterium]|nr:hypothetical protein [bacterium]
MDTLQLQEFFVEGGHRQTSHVLLHIAEPSTPEEKKKGYFFAVCELNDASDEDIVSLQNLIGEIENRYYEIPDETNNEALEDVLTQINQQAIDLIQANLKLHCVVGVLRQPDIYFASHGKPIMVLFYKTKTNLYQKMDLISEEVEEEEKKQVFQQIVQGKISTDDYLFISTPHVGDYFSSDRLHKIISSRPVRQSAEHLERVLSELKNKLSFGGLLIHLIPTNDAVDKIKKVSPIIKGSSEKSLKNLFFTERQTASTLSPSFMPNLSGRLKDMLDKPIDEIETTNHSQKQDPETRAEINALRAHAHRPVHSTHPDDRSRDQINWQEVVTNTMNSTLKGLKYAFLVASWIVVYIVNSIRGLLRFFGLVFLVITNIKNRRQSIIEDWSRSWFSFKRNIQQLPVFTKILFLIAIIGVLIFVISIVNIRSNRAEAVALKNFTGAAEAVTAKKDAAESALVYRDEDSALRELQNAETLMNQIDCTPKERITICKALNEQLADLLARLRKTNQVKAELVVDWSTHPDSLSKITKISNKIIALSKNKGEFLIYNLLTKETKNITLEKGIQEITAPKENDYALIIGNNTLWQYNPENDSVTKATFSFPNENYLITSAVIYNRRLYALDANNNQIYKNDSARNGYSPGKEWVKEINIINGTTDLTIDGDIYTTKPSGEIIKLVSGKKENFTIRGLIPELKNISEIWTYTDNNNIYILDSVEKRIVIVSKDGQTKNQLSTTDWKNPTGMTIDQTNQQIYILDSNKLYRIALQ